jgi:hypothetical protein
MKATTTEVSSTIALLLAETRLRKMALRTGTEVPRSLENTTRPRTGPLRDRGGEYPPHELSLGDSLRGSPPSQGRFRLRI